MSNTDMQRYNDVVKKQQALEDEIFDRLTK